MYVEESTAGSLALPTEKLSPALLSAIFDSISSPFETIARTIDGGFVVNLQNVEDLYYRIKQITQQYRLQGLRCEFVMSVEEGGVYRFRSLEKLKAANLSALSKEVTAFRTNFDILILPPESDDNIDEAVPQRFKLSVAVEDPWRAIEREGDYSFLSIRLRQPKFPSAVIKVDFSDYAVSRTLIAVAEEWLDGLRTDNVNTISTSSRKIISALSSYMPGILPISAIIGGIIFEPHRYENIFSPMRYLLFVTLIAICMVFVGVKAEERVSKLLYILTPKTSFGFSTGDRKRSEKDARQRRKSLQNLTFIFVGVVIASGVSFLTNYLSIRLFSH